ncbi:hypothetical protein [Nocardia lijiangensis]|uniref:hypothetical protein n=1 Tax=Nocardia lijiangensis TaxID=299618 RepID=UPI003D711351
MGGVLAALRPWSVQPVAAGVFVALGCAVAIVFELETRLVFVLAPRQRFVAGSAFRCWSCARRWFSEHGGV